MLRKTLTGVVLVLGLLHVHLANALSLGELSLDSALNQPFRAVIPVRDAGNLDSSQVIVKLASTDDFARAGVDYGYLLSRLNFRVEMNADGSGRGRVHISTTDPVVEPYLNFIVEARWPSGRMLREYTVLLDLPVTTDQRTPSVETMRGGVATQLLEREEHGRETTEVQSATQERRPALRGPEQRTQLPAADGPREYRVQHNDTLWEIAMQARPSSDVSVHQTMLALVRNNPDAFIGGNINRVKSGYVLRFPTEAEASALAQGDAMAEVARQNAVWSGRLPADAASTPVPDGPTLTTREPATPPESARADVEAAPRLSIAAPGDADSEGAADEGVASALRDQLAASEEDLDRSRREQAELQSRVQDLEEQLVTLQRLLQLKDDELAALQGAAPADAGPADAEPAAPTPAPVTEITGSDNRTLYYAALAVAILLLVVLLMRYQRNRQARELEDAADSEMPEGPVIQPAGQSESRDNAALSGFAAAGAATGLAAAGRDQDDRESDTEDDVFTALQAEDTETDESFALDDLMSDDGDELSDFDLDADTDESVQAETGDAIAEADIYVAYGRYDQAIQLLNNAIAQEPARSDLRVKLLEIYLDTHDRDNFMVAYEELKALGDDAAIASVKESMSAVEGVSDWLRSEDTADTPASATGSAPLDATDAATVADDNDDTGLELSDSGDSDESVLDKSSGDVEELEFSLDDLATEDEDFLSLEGDEVELDSDDDLSPVGDEAPPAQDDPVQSEVAGADEALDFNLDDLDADAGRDTSADADELDLDFELDKLDQELDSKAAEEPAAVQSADEPQLAESDDAVSEGSAATDFAADYAETDSGAEGSGLDLDDIAGSADSEELEEFGMLGDSDEVSTKLDLARAYIDMGDTEGARDMLQEVLEEGDDTQKRDASALLDRL